jgi:hypothetical protein
MGVLEKMLEGWKEDHRFPALDVLRIKASRPASIEKHARTGEKSMAVTFK